MPGRRGDGLASAGPRSPPPDRDPAANRGRRRIWPAERPCGGCSSGQRSHARREPLPSGRPSGHSTAEGPASSSGPHGTAAPASDIQTAQLSLGPDGAPGRGGPDDEPTDYVARTSLRADLRDLDAAGATLDAAVDAADGHATLRSLGFSLDDDGDLVVDAREAAFDEARAKAEQYADLAGRSLGELTGLAEDDTPRAPAPGRLRGDVAMEERADDGPPVEPGEEEVQVRVRATWALE